MASTAETPSLGDRLSHMLSLPLLAFNFLKRFPYLSATTTLHWRQTIALSFLQAEYLTFTPAQRHAQSRKQLTGAAIESYCQSHNLTHTKLTLSPSSFPSKTGQQTPVPSPIIHFVTDPTSSVPGGPTLFYSHGGAYTKPMRAGGHIPFVLHLARAAGAKQIVFLEYSLAPEYRYPVQLVQIVTAIRHLLSTGLQPGEMILAGDSAGGHLTASLLAHVVRPSPYAPALNLMAGERFEGVVLVSPFVDLSTGWASYEQNAGTDYLVGSSVEGMIGEFRPDTEDVWGNINDGEGAKEVWERVFRGDGKVVERVMVTAGQGEVLVDGIRRFAREFVGCETVVVGRGSEVEVLGGMDSVMLEAEGEAHVQPALDAFVGFEGGGMMRGIVAFLEGS